MTGLDAVATQVVRLLDARRIPYVLMGGLAARVHAIPRPTYDVDLTVAMPRTDLPSFYISLEELGFTVPPAQLEGWIDTVKTMPVVKFQAGVGGQSIDVDVFLAETPFQNELLTRKQRHQAGGLDGWFVSAEDLVLLKLIAGRPKDKIDVADVLFIQGPLDAQYLAHWAKQLGVENELRQALAVHDTAL